MEPFILDGKFTVDRLYEAIGCHKTVGRKYACSTRLYNLDDLRTLIEVSLASSREGRAGVFCRRSQGLRLVKHGMSRAAGLVYQRSLIKLCENLDIFCRSKCL